MIANINPRGHSFSGVTAYLLHDKGADTSERVMWSSTRNLHTDDIEKASRFMAWTDTHRDTLRTEAGGSAAGRKSERGNVYHYSLSWKAGREVTPEEMHQAAETTIERLGLAEHQAYMVAHSDTEHAHIHVVANLVHPETGLVASNYRDWKLLDRWANEYEQEHGVECERRAAKYEQWEQERPAFKVKEAREQRAQTVTEAFHRSDTGRAFAAALESDGLALAQGSRRAIVVVDQSGEVFALNRLIDLADGTKGRAKSKAIADRLQDVDRAALPDAEALATERKSFDRDAAEVDQQNALARAAEAAAETKAKEQERQEKQRRQQQAKAKHAAETAAAIVKERQALWKALQREITRKTAASRKRWQLDELGAKLEEANAEAAKLRGFWARVFKRREIAKTAARVDDYTQRLEERTERFKADVQVFTEERPAWLVKREAALKDLEASLTKKPGPAGGPSPSGGGREAPDAARLARAREVAKRAAQRERDGENRDLDRDHGLDPGR